MIFTCVQIEHKHDSNVGGHQRTLSKKPSNIGWQLPQCMTIATLLELF
jgi:hypothetical protein